jgi:phosphatidylserine decarboxylase precursor-related protein
VKKQAVVVGLETNGLSVVRSLGRAGVPVIGLTSDPNLPTARSRYCRVIETPDERSAAIVDCLEAIGRQQEAALPLFLTMERTVQIVSEQRDRLVPYFLFQLPDEPMLRELNDKASFARIATEAGLLVPRTHAANEAEGLLKAARHVGFPLIAKPLEKGGTFDAYFKARALRFDSLAEMEQRFAGFRWGQTVLVQQFIDGPDSEIYFCLTYFDRNSEPKAHFTGRKVRIWPRVSGNTASALPATVPEVTEATLALFRSVGFRGLGSLEFKRELASGRLYVIEPTVGRSDYQSGVAPANGVNIAYAAYLDLLGELVQAMSPAAEPVLWVDPVSDARSASAAIEAGELDALGYRRSLAGRKVYTVYAGDDPWPYLVERYKAILVRIKVLLLRLLDAFPGLYAYFKNLVPPDLRWPPQEVMESLKRHESPRQSFVDYFTRDPERRVPKEPRIIVSPADGVVRNVFQRDGRKVIDISMNFYDVHVQRVPLDGTVLSVEEMGRRVARDSEDERRYFVDPWEYEADYLFPVQKVVRLDTEIGEVVVRQISSIWASRIATFIEPGERVVAGQRLGHILFGSTVVLELPLAANVVVEPQIKDRPRKRTDVPISAGETIVARY